MSCSRTSDFASYRQCRQAYLIGKAFARGKDVVGYVYFSTENISAWLVEWTPLLKQFDYNRG
jgi:hypothetical protein